MEVDHKVWINPDIKMLIKRTGLVSQGTQTVQEAALQ